MNKIIKINKRGESIGSTLFILLIIFLTGAAGYAQKYNLKPGFYPGDPKENFAPSFKIDNKTYRNIALLKPVYCSSSYDFCLTPQLITDGIIETHMPGWLVTSGINGISKRPDP